PAPQQASSAPQQASAPAASAGAAPAENGNGSDMPIYLQIAALGSADNARALKARLESELSHPVRVADATGMYRVQVGPLAHAGQVEPVRDELRRAGFEQAFIVNGAD
ncbi:MAG: SPOR domain-containing protein, partial [Billgrantia desiderata]